MAAALDHVNGVPFSFSQLVDDRYEGIMFSACSEEELRRETSDDQQSVFDVSDYLSFEESSPPTDSSSDVAAVNGVKRFEVEVKNRIGFRMKSDVDVLDDGFKWRKYGKKSVKNSPNPRNYYKCSNEGCGVKKRVERDGHSPEYVITTYEGVHNHRSLAI